ncbi:MAG TPA: S-layer protein, partial [Candidatus Altiarchaeales archaeon]|nr:S-layer protein [Candidatus Altiarchaeales archaeon]
MKSIDVKKIGTLAASTLMLGAALAGPVSAGIDMTGVDKGFFYDANFNPIVQIVVGEKGMATDAVAAGNIAATIGNLAYMTKTETFKPEYTPEGQVVIETAAIGATGDYVQDDSPEKEGNSPENITKFYDKEEGFHFDDEKTYERGDFTQYALACEQQTRTEAGILMEGTYNNIHCLFCMTLCVEGLKNPSHEMKEQIYVNSSMIRYYEEGLNDDDTEALKMAIKGGAIKYTVQTGYIPLEDMDIGTGSREKFADFEYRGKIIFMGNEYYVKDIDGDKIYLAEGKVLDDITSEGYTSEFKGYKFKIDHLIYSGEYEVAGILLDVEKPDGTVVQVQISKMANGVVDDLEIAGVYAETAGAVETASIIVYDTSTQIVLEDGEDLELGGVEYDGWRVNWKKYAHPCNYTGADWDCDISEYENVNYDVLKQIDVTLTEDKKGVNALGVDESLNFPSQFMLTFKGYMTGNYRDAPCSGEGEGNIVLERGSDVYQMLLSFTGEDGNRYDDVRLDEGPFSKGDTFILDGNVWEYSKYKKNSGAEDKDDTVDITRKPLISGSKVKRTLYRFCDPEGTGISSLTDCNLTAQLADPDKDPTCNCTGLPEIEIRKIALVDAMDDTDPSKYERDENITLDPKDMFWGLDSEGSFKDKVLWFDESSNTIVYDEDKMLTVNPDMVGTIDKFETDNYLTMKVMRECDFLNDVNANNTMNES